MDAGSVPPPLGVRPKHLKQLGRVPKARGRAHCASMTGWTMQNWTDETAKQHDSAEQFHFVTARHTHQTHARPAPHLAFATRTTPPVSTPPGAPSAALPSSGESLALAQATAILSPIY